MWLALLIWLPVSAGAQAPRGAPVAAPKAGPSAEATVEDGHDAHDEEDPREALRDYVTEQAPIPATELRRGPAGVAYYAGELRTGRTDRVKLHAARSLAQLAAEGEASATPAMVGVLRDKDAGTARIFTAIAMRDSRSSEAVPPLIEVLADRSIPAEARKQAALSLGQLGDPRGRDPLLAAMDDPTSPDVRYYAYAALTLPGMNKITPQAPLLLKILKDPEQNQFRRSRAALHLNKRGNPSVVDPLIEILLKEPRSRDIIPEQRDPTSSLFAGIMSNQRNVRARIVAPLGTYGDGRVVRPILLVMSTAGDDPAFLKGADKALGKVAKRVGPEPFLAALKDPDPGVRRQAALAVADLDDVDRAAVLGPLLNDEDAGVRRAASSVLKPASIGATGGGDATASEKK
jgi:HEAT repeat protein